MQDLAITCHSPITERKLSEISDPAATLLKGIDAMEAAGVDWWVSGGTALGLWRAGDFIPDDTDHDVGVRSQSGREHLEVPGMTLARTTEWMGLPMQTAYVDGNGCVFDVFYYYTDLVKGWLVAFAEGGIIAKPLFETRRYPTKYGDLPFLSPPDEYLADRFGHDWKTPKKEKGKYAPADFLG